MPLKRPFPKRICAGVVLLALFLAAGAHAYVDLAPTLAKIVSESRQIALVQVVRYEPATQTVVLQPVRVLKGDPAAAPIAHVVSPGDGSPVPRAILQWASPGASAVLFSSRSTTLVCVGENWYQARLSGSTWKLGPDRPDLPLAYCGTVSRLADAIAQVLAGHDAIITNVPHGANGEAASFDLALHRSDIPGLVKLQRMRLNMSMVGPEMATSANRSVVLGLGPVDVSEVPALLQKLSSPEAMVRAEAAQDLRSLGAGAATAAEPLSKLLSDSAPSVRLSAASALLKTGPAGTALETAALDVLASGMSSSDAAIRREAAKAAGLAGPRAAALGEKLAKLLADPDQSVQVATLQAISVLGPAVATAAASVKELLDNPDLLLDAVDALGRIGPAARPIPPQLAKMVSSSQLSVQWAALRAMSQIGGPEAHPAVEFMIKALPHAGDVDAYNMLIFLSLLGPDAIDAQAVVRATSIRNPVVPAATLWALSPEKYLPWQGETHGTITTAPAHSDLKAGAFDVAGTIYGAYIDELAHRLRPVSPILARKIMDASAGKVPDWGYRLLNTAPEEAIGILIPALSDPDRVKRERAVNALGHMGEAAKGAKDELTQTLARTSDDREKRLIQWSLRQITPD